MIRRRLRTLGPDQSGFSLTELLTAMSIGMVLLIAAFTLLDRATTVSASITDRTEAVQRGRTAMERVTRQLRSQVCPTTTGSSLTTADANTLTLYVDMTGGSSAPERRTITYDPTAPDAD